MEHNVVVICIEEPWHGSGQELGIVFVCCVLQAFLEDHQVETKEIWTHGAALLDADHTLEGVGEARLGLCPSCVYDN